MDNREEVRAASTLSPRANASPSDQWRLPMLCARPGNVGVQIDAFRMMHKMFNRPRQSQFTEHFQGRTYENHSMDNYERVLERTQRRALIVQDRLEKLKQHEARILAEEEKRRQRCHNRELAHQRHEWLMHHAAKRVDQQEREEQAAVEIQRHIRGTLARVWVVSIRQRQQEDEAARRLQRSMRTMARKRRMTERCQEKIKERRMRAATIIQRRARKHQATHGHIPLEPLMDTNTCEIVTESQPTGQTEEDPTDAATEDDPPPTLDHAVSLELLFTPPETYESTESVEQLILHETKAAPTAEKPVLRPQRPPPASFKRVGGGFRASSFPQSPRGVRLASNGRSALISRPNPPQHHQPRTPRARAPAKSTPSARSLAQSPRALTEPALCLSLVTHDDDEDTMLDFVEQPDAAIVIVDSKLNDPETNDADNAEATIAPETE